MNDFAEQQPTGEKPLRRGLAPFGEKLNKEDGTIISSKIPTSLGQLYFRCDRPETEERILKESSDDSRGMTIDENGEQVLRSTRQMYKEGYYEISAQYEPFPGRLTQSGLKINVWLEGTNLVCSDHLESDINAGYEEAVENYQEEYHAIFAYRDKESQEFIDGLFLPENLLPRLRFSIEQETTIQGGDEKS